MDKPTARFDADAHAAEVRAQGFTVIADFMDAETIQAVRDALAPYEDSHHGRNDFEGLRTERVYTLVARGKVFEHLAEDARVLALMERFLQPGFQLTASQSIRINPGATSFQCTVTLPPVPLSAPYLAALVASSCVARPSESASFGASSISGPSRSTS